MIKMSCTYCGTLHEVKEISRNETIEFKGKNVVYKAVHYECCNCHEVFDSAEMMDKNILAAHEAYEAQYESFTPEKIIKIRESYNASQKSFSLILGMGELTINAYEQGKSIPNSTNRLLLQLSENPLIFFEMYKKNKNKIGAIQRERIESSGEYIKCNKWGGLENLYTHLSSVERESIENKTYIFGDTVTQIVTDMEKAEINKPSFEIYKDAHEVETGTLETQLAVGVA